MQLSPQLLRSVALGLGLTTALCSCDLANVNAEPLDHSEQCTKEICADDCKKAGATATPDWSDYSCPGCGMG